MADSIQIPALDVVLDTSVWNHDLYLRGAEFRALERLAVAGFVKLYLPVVVEGELKAHITEHCNAAIDGVLKPLISLLRKPPPLLDKEKFDSFKEFLEAYKADYLERVIADHDKRLQKMVCEKIEIKVGHAVKTMENYFAGRPPFRNPRCKDDFPDGFICEAIRDLSKKSVTVHVIVNDKRLQKACSELGSIRTYPNLQAFLSTSYCSNLLLEEEARKNVLSVLELLNCVKLQEFDWDDWTLENLADSSFYDSRLPGDDGEGYIVGVYSPFDTVINTANASYLGEGMFSIPVTLQVLAEVSYAIFKGDFYLISDKRAKRIGLSERNEHYWEADEELCLTIEGTVIIEFDLDDLRNPSLSGDELTKIIQVTEMIMQPDYVTKLSENGDIN